MNSPMAYEGSRMRWRSAQETATSATAAKQDSTKPYIAFQAVISFFGFT